MDDNGVAVLAWCPNCALPVGFDSLAARESRCPVCEVGRSTAGDPAKPERDAVRSPESTRSIEDLV
jgi:hypothetical protein